MTLTDAMSDHKVHWKPFLRKIQRFGGLEGMGETDKTVVFGFILTAE